MKLSDLELEQYRHFQTRRALLELQAAMLQRDIDAFAASVANRLELKLPLSIQTDGTVSADG